MRVFRISTHPFVTAGAKLFFSNIKDRLYAGLHGFVTVLAIIQNGRMNGRIDEMVLRRAVCAVTHCAIRKYVEMVQMFVSNLTPCVASRTEEIGTLL